MPRIRNVRNFWIEGETDSGTRFATGPRRTDGGFSATVYMRSRGEVSTAVEIRGMVTASGRLMLIVEPGADLELFVGGIPQPPASGAGTLQIRSER